MVEITITTNKKWNSQTHPSVTVITSTYNRRELLERAMKSVDSQTFKDMEYIVVDNGSTINLDDTVADFMVTASIPVMYIKRSEGRGPHTGKNSAIAQARGKFLTMLDSDDELLPDAIKTLVDAWLSIPESHRESYREVVAQCVDEYGNRVGAPFPEGINDCSPEEAFRIWHDPAIGAEHVNMSRTRLLKEMPFPEPEGVSWVVDSVVLWNRLSKKYKSYFINDTLKRYYVDSPDSISSQEIRKITPKHLVNMLWAHKFELSHWHEYSYSFKDRLDRTLKVALYMQVLQKLKQLPVYDWVNLPVQGLLNRFLICAWTLPCRFIGCSLFISKKMK